MRTVVIIGASVNWTPKLAEDLLAVFPDSIEIRFVDINPVNAALCVQWGQDANRYFGRNDRYVAFENRREALRGADAVLITISTGGFDAMRNDLEIPEKYGIMATVGDTAGPGGWSRAVRNIPVFREFAGDFKEVCPEAFIVNYTNPMSALTATLQLCCPNPVVGLCHAYFETLDVIQGIFGLKDWSELSVEIAGMNHFTWVTGMKIGGRDGYALLRERTRGRSLRDVMPLENADEIGFVSGNEICAELYDAYGYLCYPADRHIAEFLPFTLYQPEIGKTVYNGHDYETVLPWQVRRTRISHREAYVSESMKYLESMATREAGAGTPKKSRETGADMIRGYLENRPVRDAVNTLNIGQAAGLPEGACVETLGVVDGFGVRPLTVGSVPEPLLELMRPQAVNTKWVVDGMLRGDRALLVQALMNDPQCRALRPEKVREMAEELLVANTVYYDLPNLK